MTSTDTFEVSDYDAMGRLERKLFSRSGPLPGPLLVDFEYDELGRPTLIEYPDNQTIVRYEYVGDYLKTVCEVASASDDCVNNEFLYVSDVTYNDLGQREDGKRSTNRV